MRSILVALFLLLFLICSIPLMLIEWVIGKFSMEVKSRSSLAIVNWAFHCVTFISGVTTTVIGLENVPEDEAVLYIGNHRSYFDIVLTYPLTKRPTGYIAKLVMTHYPLLRVWMRYLHCLFLDRENIKEGLKTILQAIEKVKSGISIAIFPEGTRNDSQEPLLPFHEGSFKIAEKSGCAIIPMTLNHTSEILEDHMPWIRKTHVIIEYGKPIYTKNMSKDEKKAVPKQVYDIIRETYLKNQTL